MLTAKNLPFDYNPIDKLVGIYNDLVATKLLTIKEYADSVNKTADAQRNLDQANKQVKESSATVGETRIVLKDEVKDVVISERLTDSPVCLFVTFWLIFLPLEYRMIVSVS